MKNKLATIGIIAVAAIILLVIIYGFTAKTTIVNSEGQTVTTQTGLGDTISNIFGSGGFGGWVKNIFGDGKGNQYCDCSRVGYAKDGKPDSLCNANGIQYERDCA